MNWHLLTQIEQLQEIIDKSAHTPQVIYKHSTRCSISVVVKNRLEKEDTPKTVDFHYLDLLAYRPVSNAVAEQFSVQHESPQVLVIKNGKCVYDDSHMAINMDDIIDQAAAA
ncbi:MAG: bacillithiol system redox-active protein YtxJ [Chitinophagaceae bacterium]|nr:MAG: bacillithiol system redox-active protein YtxJ [Chitinophagaceae bacterium]